MFYSVQKIVSSTAQNNKHSLNTICNTYHYLYNYRNLPVTVKLVNNVEVSYTYDAEGTKLTRKIKQGNGATQQTSYEGSFVYQTDANNKLALSYFAHTQGGRVTVTNNIYKYEYFLADHLGNVRATFGADQNGNLDILQTTDYYPFGLTMAGNKTYSGQEYQYGGKEWQNATNVYDFHSRQYNPALGRWFNQDPMVEKYTSVSPYNYCLNNPFNTVDPTGMYPEAPLWDSHETMPKWGSFASFMFAGYNLQESRMYSQEYYGGGGSSGGGSGGGGSSDGSYNGVTRDENGITYWGTYAQAFFKLLNIINPYAVSYNGGEVHFLTSNFFSNSNNETNHFYATGGVDGVADKLGIKVKSFDKAGFAKLSAEQKVSFLKTWKNFVNNKDADYTSANIFNEQSLALRERSSTGTIIATFLGLGTAALSGVSQVAAYSTPLGILVTVNVGVYTLQGETMHNQYVRIHENYERIGNNMGVFSTISESYYHLSENYYDAVSGWFLGGVSYNKIRIR